MGGLGLIKAHAAAMSEMENRLSRDLLEGIPGARRTVGLTWRDDVELAPAAARFLAFVVQNKTFPE